MTELTKRSIPDSRSRTFLPPEFTIVDWKSLEPYYRALLEEDIDNADAAASWLRKRSELEACLIEEGGWRYIRMTCDTADKNHLKAYEQFISEIEPEAQVAGDALNKHIAASPCIDALDGPGYEILRKNIRKEIRIFRVQNVPLLTELKDLAKDYGAMSGAMTVRIDGKEMTLQQAAVLLESTDREKRSEAYTRINQRRLQDRSSMDALFDKMLSLRHRVAVQADFDNFRDYMFTAMGRFDYEPSDCYDFQAAVSTQVVPLLDEMAVTRRARLGVDHLRPWDKAVDPTGKSPLKPFASSAQLVEKTVQCFDRLHPLMAESLRMMSSKGHLDLESRKGKAPGGYNYPLPESGLPFIFMNATSTLRDMITMLHEGGHAVHSVLTRHLELVDFQHPPSEVAELASMTTELLTMDHWDVFFDDAESVARARRQHLEQIIETLPWVACIDRFQHWLYENPDHNAGQRTARWSEIYADFSDRTTDWSGLEAYRDNLWQKQLHLFEVPFYYIEYGMAQLGALALWRNYKQHPQEATDAFLDALRLGYTQPIPEVYGTAGIEFNFSEAYIAELMQFVRTQLEQL